MSFEAKTFQAEIEKLWPGALILKWEQFKDRDFVVPVYGAGFYRQVNPRTGEVYHRTHTDDAAQAAGGGDWFKPTQDQPKARYVVRERSKKGHVYKVLDCVAEDGTPIPLSQYIIDALKRRYDAMEELERQWDEFERAQTVQDQDGVEYTLNAKQAQARKDFADEAYEPFMDLAEGLAGVEKVYMNDAHRTESGLKVVDKRRLRASDVGGHPSQD